ncbi:MAG TPA: winged helix-turn-helix transcriptional regulator [Dehalococcoidia bacterium]
MQTTKSQILEVLKRTGGSTVDELAQRLGLAPMTIRQHLTTLERDELVYASEVRRPTGRPHYVYRLTEKGDETFPRRYDRLATLLLQEVGGLDPREIEGRTAEEKTALVFEKVADRLAQQYAARLAGKSLEEKVAEVAAILHTEGGFADWARTERGFEIRDYNCVYRRVAATSGQVCQWHVRLLSRLLGTGVRCDERLSAGGECCRFVIEVPEGLGARTWEGQDQA